MYAKRQNLNNIENAKSATDIGDGYGSGKGVSDRSKRWAVSGVAGVLS